MGEEKWRVFNTGAPQLDDFNKPNKININNFNKELKIKLKKIFLLLCSILYYMKILTLAYKLNKL